MEHPDHLLCLRGACSPPCADGEALYKALDFDTRNILRLANKLHQSIAARIGLDDVFSEPQALVLQIPP